MKARFLCGNHRLELANNSAKALRYLQENLDTGQLLQEQLQFTEALPHLGCAHEIAEIVLTTSNTNHGLACELFAETGAQLAQNLASLRLKNQAREVQAQALYRLEKELYGNQFDRHIVKNQLKRLLTCLRDNESLEPAKARIAPPPATMLH